MGGRGPERNTAMYTRVRSCAYKLWYTQQTECTHRWDQGTHVYTNNTHLHHSSSTQMFHVQTCASAGIKHPYNQNEQDFDCDGHVKCGRPLASQGKQFFLLSDTWEDWLSRSKGTTRTCGASWPADTCRRRQKKKNKTKRSALAEQKTASSWAHET